MNSKSILTSIDPIAVAARAALERNKEMLDRADSIALAPKRIPEITLPDPESVREVEYDPDSVAASILLGEGTGSLPADLAIGLTGGAAGPITEAVGGKSGVLDWIPGGSLAKAGILAGMGKARKAFSGKNIHFTRDEMKTLRKNLDALSDRWIYAKADAGEDPMDWFRMPRSEQADWFRLNGLPVDGNVLREFNQRIKTRYDRINEGRVVSLLGRDIAELAPEKKEYFSPYMVPVEPPGGAASRILGSVATEEPKAVEEAVDEAKKAKYSQLLANAAMLRDKAGKKRASVKTANAKAYAKKKEEAALAEQEAVKKEWQEYNSAVKEAEAARAAEAAAREARFVDTPGGKWDWTEHPLGENGYRSRDLDYESLLGPDATPKERRAAYVLDSLASVAARTVKPKGVDNPRLELKDRQHNKTTYDEAGRRFLEDVEENMRTGNLPISGKFSTEKINLPTMGGWHEGVLLDTGDRELERVYDLLFKPRAYREVGRILKRTK